MLPQDSMDMEGTEVEIVVEKPPRAVAHFGMKGVLKPKGVLKKPGHAMSRPARR